MGIAGKFDAELKMIADNSGAERFRQAAARIGLGHGYLAMLEAGQRLSLIHI